ncbi:MAG: MaoC family dehydratase [Boseongicola sp. SB0676_bin_33]|nr:MaoC family dehydratase [Boseongicola sp. SB0676_bin_33]
MESDVKASRGRFFEDFRVGETIGHAVPRTLGDGERALYHALYPSRHAFNSSVAFARSCGLDGPLDNLLVFHAVFGSTVPDISLNAVANLGYAEGRWLVPVRPGETLVATSEVIGAKENSSGRTGVVWIRTVGWNERGDAVLSYVRWVMVRKRDPGSPTPKPVAPRLSDSVRPQDLVVPEGLSFGGYDYRLAGEPHRWSDYEVGETIDHVDRVTIEEAEHMLATRLWQNTARVHFDATSREDGRRLIYGGHVISMARELSFNGLENAQMIVGLNAGSHVAPCFAGDTVCCWSEVLEKAETGTRGVGALRLRLVAHKPEAAPFALKGEDGKHVEGVLLDLDCWALIPM